MKFLADSAKEITQEEILGAQRLHATRKRYDKKKPAEDTPPSHSREAPQKQVKSDTAQRRPLTLTLPDNGTRDVIDRIKDILDTCSAGETQIFLSHNGTRMKTSYLIDATDEVHAKLAEVVGEGAIE